MFLFSCFFFFFTFKLPKVYAEDLTKTRLTPSTTKANAATISQCQTPAPCSPPAAPPLFAFPIRPRIIPLSLLIFFVHVWMNPKCERLLQRRGKADGGDQPAHVERHGCSLMWLQLGSPGPNEVLWSPASAPAPIAYTPVAHIQPWLHHPGSLRGCSFVPPGTKKAKTWIKKIRSYKKGSADWHTQVWMR